MILKYAALRRDSATNDDTRSAFKLADLADWIQSTLREPPRLDQLKAAADSLVCDGLLESIYESEDAGATYASAGATVPASVSMTA